MDGNWKMTKIRRKCDKNKICSVLRGCLPEFSQNDIQQVFPDNHTSVSTLMSEKIKKFIFVMLAVSKPFHPNQKT